LVDDEAQVLLPPIESSATIERTIDARALLMRVRGQVTQHEWHIFWLRFGRELPPREIATLLGISVDEIHMILASAKRRLRGDSQLRHFADMSAAEKPFVVASIKRHTQINQKGAVS